MRPVHNLLLILQQHLILHFHGSEGAQPYQSTVNFSLGQRQRLPLLECQELLESMSMLIDQVSVLEQQVCTLGDRRCPPWFERTARCIDGDIEILATSNGDFV
jgi:hypothetical protein